MTKWTYLMAAVTWAMTAGLALAEEPASSETIPEGAWERACSLKDMPHADLMFVADGRMWLRRGDLVLSAVKLNVDLNENTIVRCRENIASVLVQEEGTMVIETHTIDFQPYLTMDIGAIRRGRAEIEAGDFDQAALTLDQVEFMELHAEWSSFHDRISTVSRFNARQLASQHKIEEAIAHLEKAIAAVENIQPADGPIAPTDPVLAMTADLAGYLLQTPSAERGRNLLRQMQQSNPDYGLSYLYLADDKWRAEDKKGARELYLGFSTRTYGDWPRRVTERCRKCRRGE